MTAALRARRGAIARPIPMPTTLAMSQPISTERSVCAVLASISPETSRPPQAAKIADGGGR